MPEKVMIDFLRDLSENNSLQWMHANQDYKKLAVNEFINFIDKLVKGIVSFDSSIIDLPSEKFMFRLNRDIRFSKDKSPYNPSFRANIGSEGRLFIPVGYFIQISGSGESFLGGGIFATQFSNATNMIRDYIFKNQKEFLKIIENDEFKKRFIVQGEKLKNLPRGYESSDIDEYIKHKSWYLEYSLDKRDLEDEEAFLKTVIDVFENMKPFNDYLNKALVGFEMPKRR